MNLSLTNIHRSNEYPEFTYAKLPIRSTYTSTELFWIMSPTRSFCRTIGMNHFAIARNQGFRVSHLSIISQLRSLSKRSRFPDTPMTQRPKKLLDQLHRLFSPNHLIWRK